MDHKLSLKAILLALCVAPVPWAMNHLINATHAQDPLMIFGSSVMDLGEAIASPDQVVSLPTSFDPSINDFYEYQGQVAQYAQAVQYDPQGKVWFFIQDGHIYNAQGLLIADGVDDPNCRNCLWNGANRVLIVPITASCERFLIITATSDETDREQNETIDVRMGILDMAELNDDLTAVRLRIEQNQLVQRGRCQFLVSGLLKGLLDGHFLEGHDRTDL